MSRAGRFFREYADFAKGAAPISLALGAIAGLSLRQHGPAIVVVLGVAAAFLAFAGILTLGVAAVKLLERLSRSGEADQAEDARMARVAALGTEQAEAHVRRLLSDGGIVAGDAAPTLDDESVERYGAVGELLATTHQIATADRQDVLLEREVAESSEALALIAAAAAAKAIDDRAPEWHPIGSDGSGHGIAAIRASTGRVVMLYDDVPPEESAGPEHESVWHYLLDRSGFDPQAFG